MSNQLEYKGYRLVRQANGSYVIYRLGEEKWWSAQPSLDFAKKCIDDAVAITEPKTGSSSNTVVVSNGVAAI